MYKWVKWKWSIKNCERHKVGFCLSGHIYIIYNHIYIYIYIYILYRKSGKFRVENFSCCIFSRGEIFVIYCIDEIFTVVIIVCLIFVFSVSDENYSHDEYFPIYGIYI